MTISKKLKMEKLKNPKILSVIEQGFFSITAVLNSTFIARNAGLEVLGIYTALYSIFLLLSGFFNAFLIEPVPYIISKKHSDDDLRGFFTFFGGLAGIFIGLTLLVFGLIYLDFSKNLSLSGKQSLGGLSISSPLTLMFWLARRQLYATGMYLKAAILSAGTAAVYTAFLIILSSLKIGPLSSALLSIIGSAAFATALGVYFIKPRWVANAMQQWRPQVNLAIQYGRWAAVTAVLGWAVNNLSVLVIGAISSASDAGLLRVIYILILPFTTTTSALVLTKIPYLMGSTKADHVRYLRTWSLMFIGGGISYGLFLVILRGFLEDLFHSTIPLSSIIYAVGFAVSVSVLNVMTTLSRVEGKPKLEMLALLPGTIVLIAGLGLTQFISLPVYLTVLSVQTVSTIFSGALWISMYRRENGI